MELGDIYKLCIRLQGGGVHCILSVILLLLGEKRGVNQTLYNFLRGYAQTQPVRHYYTVHIYIHIYIYTTDASQGHNQTFTIRTLNRYTNTRMRT